MYTPVVGADEGDRTTRLVTDCSMGDLSLTELMDEDGLNGAVVVTIVDVTPFGCDNSTDASPDVVRSIMSERPPARHNTDTIAKFFIKLVEVFGCKILLFYADAGYFSVTIERSVVRPMM